MRAGSPLTCLLVLLAAGCKAEQGPVPPSVEELIAMLQKDDPKVQMEALAWIKDLGPKAAPTRSALIAVLKGPHAHVRQAAASALADLGPEAAGAVPALTEALNDSEIGVRRAAAESLGRIGPAAASAIPALEKLNEQPDPCQRAQTALQKIRK